MTKLCGIVFCLTATLLFCGGCATAGRTYADGSVQANSGAETNDVRCQMTPQRLPAFPSAEGSGRYTQGGRGGDVYHVTSLDDPYDKLVEGTFRHAIRTANGPRTIVFDVGGTIYLQRNLNSAANYLTIAGQTAPGGGITIANHEFVIRHSHDVIVQNLRFAPGDALTRLGTENEPGHIRGGNPRPLRIWGERTRNVIVDHVTARWGPEDCLSTHPRVNNVTVQNSIIGESLHDADHYKGRRGYGSQISGPNVSFIGNLYTQNNRRNPRPSGATTKLEFVNNVVYNWGSVALQFGNGPAKVNYINNIGIRGPESHDIALVEGVKDSFIYAQGNFHDSEPDRSLDLNRARGRIVASGIGLLQEPVEIADSEYNPVPARQAYIHVLSRGGASMGRDLHDKRMVRGVVERGGFHIDRPEDVGGYGKVDSGGRVVSTARDGIADWWKIRRGLDPQKQYHQVYGDHGYTYLEHYLHSLMEPIRVPVNTKEIVIKADDWPKVNWPEVEGHKDYVLLRFDMSSIKPGSIMDAKLKLNGGGRVGTQVKARDPMVKSNEWDHGNENVDPKTYKTSPWRLGELSAEERFDSPNLAVFLNSSLQHYSHEKDSGIVTLLIETKGDWTADKLAPRLVLEALYVDGMVAR